MLCIAACSADAPLLEVPRSPASLLPDASAAGVSALDAGDASSALPSPRDFSVRAVAQPARICAGECSQLSVEVSGGRAPIALAWQGPGVQGTGPWSVCPRSTTSYQVTAEDTASGEVEFPMPARRAEGRVTVHVQDNCAEDAGPGPQVDAGPEPQVDAGSSATECSIRIPVSPHGGSADVRGRASADAHGNLYVALAFFGELQLGDQPAVSVPNGMERLLLAKYDAQCALQWQRFIGAPQEIEYLADLRANAAGEVALLHSHAAPAQNQPRDYRTQLLVLDPSGTPLWTRESRNGPLLTRSQNLAWGSDGSLAVTGLNELCGAGPVGCAAKIDPQRNVVAGPPLDGPCEAAVALDAQGGLLIAGVCQPIDTLKLPGIAPVPLPSAAVVMADFAPSGAARWAVTTPIVEAQHIYEEVGFVGALEDGTLLAAWRPPGWGSRIATWTLGQDGKQRAHVTMQIVPDEITTSSALFTANTRGELFSAIHIDTPRATRLARWRPDGSMLTQRDLPDSTLVAPIALQLSPAGALILTSVEPWTMPAGTALVVRVVTGL